MIKQYTNTHPSLGEKQFDFEQAVVSMINCRRYLVGKGFEEMSVGYSSSINNLSGTLIFENGIKVDDTAFCQCFSDRDSFLERIVANNCEFRRRGVLDYMRDKVIRTTFKDRTTCWRFHLSVVDTTRKKAGFPVGLFLMKPKKFAFGYTVGLAKTFISEKDLEDFENYRQGLQEASEQSSLVDKKPIVKKETKPVKKEEKLKFINPFEVDLPGLGGKK